MELDGFGLIAVRHAPMATKFRIALVLANFFIRTPSRHSVADDQATASYSLAPK
jgi:hypothetical protein